MIDRFADEFNVIFGHSKKYNVIAGYWCFVISYSWGNQNNRYCSQIMIGKNGNFSRFYTITDNWSDWK